MVRCVVIAVVLDVLAVVLSVEVVLAVVELAASDTCSALA